MTKNGKYLSTLIFCNYLMSNCKGGEGVNGELNSTFGQISALISLF